MLYTGEHGAPNWRMRCPYCDKPLGKRYRRPKRSKNVFDYPKGHEDRKRIEDSRTFIEPTDPNED